MRLRTKTDQTDQFTESAHGRLISRHEQLVAETRAIMERREKHKYWLEAVETILILLGLIGIFSMGAWIGPVSKLVLTWIGEL